MFGMSPLRLRLQICYIVNLWAPPGSRSDGPQNRSRIIRSEILATAVRSGLDDSGELGRGVTISHFRNSLFGECRAVSDTCICNGIGAMSAVMICLL